MLRAVSQAETLPTRPGTLFSSPYSNAVNRNTVFSYQVVNGFHMLHGPGHDVCLFMPTKC